MRFGYFDDDNREYVITRPDTPLPWINYLGTQAYFGIISNTAGGYSFYRDARLRRITRYRYNNVPTDSGGRYIYLRDESNGIFWSPSWQPTQNHLQDYECRHGMGYTRISSSYQEIHTSTRYMVPMNENVEIWETTVTNNRDSAAELSLYASVEFALWDAEDDGKNFQRNFNIGEVEIEDNVIYHKTEYRERRNHYAYFATSESPAGYDTQRENFLGAYRGWHNPMAVARGQMGNSHAHGWSPIGAYQHKITLQPGESKTIIHLLGYHDFTPEDEPKPISSERFEELYALKYEAQDVINKEPVRPTIAKYLDQNEVANAAAIMKETWDGYLGKYQVDSPDEHVNRMVNIWNSYQCMVTFNMSRSTSFFESGIGRGMGFRDSNQDLLGFVHMIPERARERIVDITATQRPSGGAFHQYQPLTKRGNDGLGGEFNDDPQWLIMGVAAYIKETGDLDLLDQKVPYQFTEDEIEAAAAAGEPTELTETVYNHLVRALDYTINRLGSHGLPLIGRADWNDCLNLNCFSPVSGESFQTTEGQTDGKVAESVFIAVLFTHACREMAALAAAAGKQADQAKYLEMADAMTATVLEHGWDGDWFLRAYDHFGNKIGTAANTEGAIYIEPQGIAAMAGIGVETGEAQKALDAVGEHLATPHGIVLHQPAYQRYYLHMGEISSYPPGYKENAGIFCHTNPWIVWGETVIRRPDKAFDYYMRICPSNREAISDTHRTEPYVYSQMIAGKDAPTHGEAKNSWLTGTASWNYISITQAILGVHPDYDGIKIDPVIPTTWPGVTITRVFRGTTYVIAVDNASGAGCGVTGLSVDGAAVDGNLIPYIADGGTHQVRVTLG